MPGWPKTPKTLVMPLTPKPTDYVSTVRGFLNDLRQAELQQAQINLSYAQLGQQRANAERQAGLQQQQMELSELQNQRALESDAYNHAYNRQRQNFSDALALRRMDLDQQIRLDDLRQKREREDQETSAGALENEFRIAMESNDPKQLSQVMDKISKANFTAQLRTQIQANVFSALDKKRQFEQIQKNLDTAPAAQEIISQLRSLDPQNFTRQQYAAKTSELINQFSNLGNTDNKLLGEFFDAQKVVQDRETAYLNTKSGGLTKSFVALGEYKELEPKWQKMYDELKAKPEDYTENALYGLAKKRNREFTIARLQDIDRANIRLLEDISKNPQLAGRDISNQLPDLTPVESEDGNIDPITGGLTESFRKRQAAWEDDLRKPSFILGQQLTMQQAMVQNLPTMPPVKQAKPEEQPKTAPIQSRSRFETAQAGPTATIPVAPQTQGISNAFVAQAGPTAPGNINNLEANKALYAQVQKQLKEGKQYFEVADPVTGEVKITKIPLATLNANLPSIIQRQERVLVTAPTSPEERR